MDNLISFDYKKMQSQLETIGKSFLSDKLRPEMKKKMNQAVNLIYETARTPRPMARNLLGRKGPAVSSVSARFGVPVQTGNLRNSIKKEIKDESNKITGRVFVDMKKAPYAMRIEYGFVGADSLGRHYRQLPRPFMRPAYMKNINEVYKIFRKK